MRWWRESDKSLCCFYFEGDCSFLFKIYMHTCVQENAGSAEYDMDCLLRSEVKPCHCFLESRLRCLRITVFITIVRLNIQKNVAETDFDSKAAKATRSFYQALHIQEWNSYDQLWVFPQNVKKWSAVRWWGGCEKVFDGLILSPGKS